MATITTITAFWKASNSEKVEFLRSNAVTGPHHIEWLANKLSKAGQEWYTADVPNLRPFLFRQMLEEMLEDADAADRSRAAVQEVQA